MAWVSPDTHIFVTLEILTSTTMNTFLKGNSEDLHRRTQSFSDFVGPMGAVASSEGWVNLVNLGPAVTVVIGSTNRALLSLACAMATDTAGGAAYMGHALSGAHTQAPADAEAISFNSTSPGQGIRHGMTFLHQTITTGPVTVTAKYRSEIGAGVCASEFSDRRVTATPLGS